MSPASDERLRSPDFEALGATVDSWLASHDELPGVVIHATGFPGWENITALLGHVGFVRAHQRRVRRIALAVEAPWSASHRGWPSPSSTPR